MGGTRSSAWSISRGGQIYVRIYSAPGSAVPRPSASAFYLAPPPESDAADERATNSVRGRDGSFGLCLAALGMDTGWTPTLRVPHRIFSGRRRTLDRRRTRLGGCLTIRPPNALNGRAPAGSTGATPPRER